MVLLPGLTKLFPCLSLCPGNHRSSSLFGLLVPVCSLGSPTKLKSLWLLLQLDDIPHRLCPLGLDIVTMTGTDYLGAKALVSRLDNGCTEHGPLGPNFPDLPRDMVEAPPELGVKALSDSKLCQAFPADPHNTFWSAGPDQHTRPPSTFQRITRWWLVDSSAPLFTQVSKTCSCKSDDKMAVDKQFKANKNNTVRIQLKFHSPMRTKSAFIGSLDNIFQAGSNICETLKSDLHILAHGKI